MKLPANVREYFRKKGALGGKTRAQNLTAEERSEGARKAVQARWARNKAAQSETKKSVKKERGSK